MTRLVSVLICLLVVAGYLQGSELVDKAKQHRDRFIGKEGYYYYVTGTEEQIKTLAFVMAGCSTQRVIEKCIPQPVSKDLWSLNLEDLRWDWREWLKVLETYPYYAPRAIPTGYQGRSWPLVLRADWLVLKLSDTNASDAHYRLLYGKSAPKTLAQFRKFWNVLDNNAGHIIGLIEGQSGVSKNSERVRWLENMPVPRGYYWQTKDTLNFGEKKSDPLNNLDGDFHYDGQEAIVGVQKVSVTTRKSGTVQFYLLANGNRDPAKADKRIEKADGDLVEDFTRFRGKSQIRTTGSCIQCHENGINEPTENELKTILQIGVQVLSKDKAKRDAIELFHLSDTGKEIARNRQDFADGVLITNGLTPIENVAAFKKVCIDYDKEVTLEVAAAELHTTPQNLTLALGFISITNTLDARLAALVQGKPVSREVWERIYNDVYQALSLWEQSK